jgi:glycosyltransferase involved in cell wall biosynthesis
MTSSDVPRILRVIPSLDPAYGGPPVSATNSVVAALELGIPTDVVVTVRDEAVSRSAQATERMRRAGARVYTFEVWPEIASRWAPSPALMRWIRRSLANYDVIHVHSVWTLPSLYALAIRRHPGQAFVLTPHEALTDFDQRVGLNVQVKRRLRDLVLRSIDQVIFSSELEQRDSHAGALGVASSVIYHPVPSDREPRRDRRVPPGSVRELTLGYLGRLHPKKNVGLLIQAAGAIGCKLIIAGDAEPSYVKQLTLTAESQADPSRIQFIGFLDRSQHQSFYDSIDLAAMPSQYECFGMSAAEALIAGVPVLVSESTGVAELITRHGGGIVIRPERGDIIRAITSLYSSPDVLSTMFRESAIVAKHLSPYNHAVALRDLYRSALSRVR